MKCKYCKKECVKTGVRNGIQRYRCKHCQKYQQEYYTKPRISKRKYKQVQLLNNEGCGIRSISRLLYIAASSVVRFIGFVANLLSIPQFKEKGENYEIDELRTFCGNKKNECWVIYAINRKTKQVVNFCVGRRTKENINKVVKAILLLSPKTVYSDSLNIYLSLIPKANHKIHERCTNHIERKNLSLRTHLKRLCRKTICFTKSQRMLENCMKLYFCK